LRASRRTPGPSLARHRSWEKSPSSRDPRGHAELRTLSRLEQLVADTISVLAWRVKYAPVAPEDLDRVVEFSLRAWRPVFDSFRAVLSDAVYTRVYPDWLHTQAAAVMSVCLDQDMDVFVAINRPRTVSPQPIEPRRRYKGRCRPRGVAFLVNHRGLTMARTRSPRTLARSLGTSRWPSIKVRQGARYT
jgi:hypothetical protein